MEGYENYESTTQTAQRLGIDRSNVLRLCRQGRIPGVIKVGEGKGGLWLVPKGAVPSRANFGPASKWEKAMPSPWVESPPQT